MFFLAQLDPRSATRPTFMSRKSGCDALARKEMMRNWFVGEVQLFAPISPHIVLWRVQALFI